MRKNSNPENILQTLPYILFGIVLIAGILRIFTFSIGLNYYDLHDFIEGVLWADASLKSGSIINPNYIYYYIVPFGSNIIMAPFVKLLGVSVTANQLGMVVYYILFLGVMLRLAESLYDDWNSRLIFCSVLCMFFFIYVGDNLLHHLLAYGIGFVCLMGMLSCLINIDKGRNIRRNRILLVLFCLWSSANGIGCAALCGLQVFASLLYANYKNQSLFSRDSIINSLCMIIPIFIGLLIFRYYDSRAITMNMLNRRFIMADVPTVVERITNTIFIDYFKVLYFMPGQVYLFSPEGAFSIIKLAYALAVPGIPVYLYRKHRDSFRIAGISTTTQTMMYTAHVLIILTCIGQFCLFEKCTHRHLFNGILSLICIGAIGMAGSIKTPERNMRIVPFLVLATVLTGHIIAINIPKGIRQKEELRNIYTVLEKEHMTRGYICSRYYKSTELFADGNLVTSVINYDQEADKFYVEYDRIYLGEETRPDTERFFILNDTRYSVHHEGDQQLEEYCTDKVTLDKVTIYFFDTEDWDTLFTVKDNYLLR